MAKKAIMTIETTDQDGNLVEEKRWEMAAVEPAEWLRWVRENWPLVLLLQFGLCSFALLVLLFVIIVGA